MTRFTPGPWCVGPSREHDFNGVKMWTASVNVGEVLHFGNSIASVQLGGDGALHSDRDSVFANARLITAAPDLYDAVREMLPLLEDGGDALSAIKADALSAMCGRARAALAKVSPQSSDPVVQSENGQEQ